MFYYLSRFLITVHTSLSHCCGPIGVSHYARQKQEGGDEAGVGTEDRGGHWDGRGVNELFCFLR